ncbi:MAG TPA: hypothetical protein VM261_24270 [Kofleriaceae bacterium]|nr:hypothetical protein [Kofleriaceae bacterium]
MARGPKRRASSGASKRLPYDERVELLTAIVAVAEEVIKGAKGLTQNEKRSEIAFGIETRELAQNSTIRTTGSINQLQSDFLVRWNEAVGPEVEEFWRRIAKRGIPIERRDVVKDVLERKRIKDRHEYETVADSIVVLQQIGKITAAQARALDQMLADFEKRSAR